jgi:site-specific DNA-methyltransferase (adenine-specific)
MQDNCVDCIITDIPYGLNFLNKYWDKVPSLETFKELNRVLKHGGFFVTTFSSRIDLQLELYQKLKDADFDIEFTTIQWIYQSGFPKANNLCKQIHKREGVEMEVIETKKQNGSKFNTIANEIDNGGFNDKNRQFYNIEKPTLPSAKYIEGIYGGYQPKPCQEPIILCQKKYKAKSQIDQALIWYNERQELLKQGIKEEDLCYYTKNCSGGTRLDDGRIAIEDNENLQRPAGNSIYSKKCEFKTGGVLGRFAPNLLVSDDCIDIGRITKSIGGSQIKRQMCEGYKSHFRQGSSRGEINSPENGFKDSGDLSRYFSLDAWTKKHFPKVYINLCKKTLTLENDCNITLPCVPCSKPSVSEKNAGLEEFKSIKSIQASFQDDKNPNHPVPNTHVTAKPISLFAYLVSVFSNENNIILEPFAGSGTTCIASLLCNRKFIGLELDKEYSEIARGRIKYWSELNIKKQKYINNIQKDTTIKNNTTSCKTNIEKENLLFDLKD